MSEEVTQERKLGVGLIIGIVLLPIVFAWFTLRKGHSTLSRVLSFGWLLVSSVIALNIQGPQGTQSAPASSQEGTSGPVVAEGITMAKYDRLKTGMSYHQAVEILGTEGVEVSSNELAGTKTVMYQWEAGVGANVNAMFQNDKLMQKAQFGLK
jgi:hypothetical protein